MRDAPLLRALPTAGLAVSLLLAQLFVPGSTWAAKADKKAMQFAMDMAERGNWREARYRWGLIDQAQRDNAHVLNNLAVAAEALGEIEEAGLYYEQATALSAGDPRIQGNYRRYRRSLEERGGESDPAPPPPPPAPPSGNGKKSKPKGKTLSLAVGIPVPPRLTLGDLDNILVISFRAPESALLDINRELVRFMRSEFRKGSSLEVLEVTPPPAIPEQAIDDLLANTEFWRHLHREHGAKIIVSGTIDFRREDASGYQEVDVTNPRTGQKVRETRFVEMEEFGYQLEMFFIEGATGSLLYRDRVERAITFRGKMNDPITAFFELSESIAADVLAVVAPRRRNEPRQVFKN